LYAAGEGAIALCFHPLQKHHAALARACVLPAPLRDWHLCLVFLSLLLQVECQGCDGVKNHEKSGSWTDQVEAGVTCMHQSKALFIGIEPFKCMRIGRTWAAPDLKCEYRHGFLEKNQMNSCSCTGQNPLPWDTGKNWFENC
jgi:hypothetical protein